VAARRGGKALRAGVTLASGEGAGKLARPDGVELLDVTTEELLARAPPPADARWHP
jgi:hypothetical protein